MDQTKTKTNLLWLNAKLIKALGLCWVLIALLIFVIGPKTNAATGINEQLNFQARLLNSAGATVADGDYNIRFKVYQDGDGVLGGGDETLKWTETRESGDKVTVKNGYFSVNLGSVTAFASNVDWDQDTLWLSVDIGGTGAPSYDGEMTPFKRLGSSPYALNAGKLGGLTAAEFVQLQASSPGTEQTGNINVSGTIIGATALQGPSVDTASAGALALGNTNATSVSLCNSATCDTVTIGTNADADTITIGDSLDTVVVNSANWSVDSSGDLTVNSCSGCGGGGGTLQQAYDAGNTITTTDGSNIVITLDDTATDSNLDIDLIADNTVTISRNDGSSTEAPSQLLKLENLDTNLTIADGLLLNVANAGVLTDGIDASDADIVNALNIGANNIVTDSATISATELNLLDGHDVALVDTNDAVTTAITGTGALDAGSITSGFGAIDTGSDNIVTTGTLQGNNVDRSSSGTLAIGNTNATTLSLCNSAACDTIQLGTNADADTIQIGDSLDTVTITGNSSSTIVLNGTTISAAELNLLDAHDVALVDTNDAVATAIIGTGALNAGSITSGFGNINIGSSTITSGAINGQTISSAANFTGTVTIASTLAANNGISVDGSTVIDNGAGWHRSYGSSGWYNGTYGGGIYMIDSTYVRVYNSKYFATSMPSGGGYLCTVYGVLYACASDKRLKENITYLGDSGVSALKKVRQLKPASFNWKKGHGNGADAGFIAQDIMKLFPELVKTNEDGYYSFNSAQLVPYAIKAIQELDTNISKLQTSGKFKNINVKGNATLAKLNVTGSSTLARLTVSGDALFNGALTIDGHLKGGGAKVTAKTKAAAGSGSSVSVDGSDLKGSIELNATSGATTGEILEVDFNTSYASKPVVLISAGNSSASEIKTYVNSSTDSFKILTNSPLIVGDKYIFNYWVVE